MNPAEAAAAAPHETHDSPATAPKELYDAAIRLLVRNRVGPYTVPSKTLYPHQWSWDSAFIALGSAHWAPRRAEEELQALLGAQWADGRVPHIVFNPDVPAESYFPGPEFWYTTQHVPTPASSGLVQPPIHARAAWEIYRSTRDQNRAASFLTRIYSRLVAYHRYLGRRDVTGHGLPVIVHPWESGLDNSPAWDQPLAAVQVSEFSDRHTRRDLSHAAATERPTDADYARYITLGEEYRDTGYTDKDLRHHPFLIEDPLFITLLAWSEHALAQIAGVIGADPSPHEASARTLTQTLIKRLYDPAQGIFRPHDVHTQTLAPAQTIGGLTPLVLPHLPRQIARALAEQVLSPRFGLFPSAPESTSARLPLPSNDRSSPTFDRRRYWRGPIWINVNWLIWRGLRTHGQAELATRLRSAMIDLVSRFGFAEYFDPTDGSPAGSSQFSWTAALTIDLLHASEMEPPYQQLD